LLQFLTVVFSVFSNEFVLIGRIVLIILTRFSRIIQTKTSTFVKNFFRLNIVAEKLEVILLI
jgi:hypothetical protein